MAFKIKRVSAFVAVDEDGEEGVIAALMMGQWMPLICADEARIDCMRPFAENIAREKNITVKLIQFDNRREVETIYEGQ